MSSEFEQPLDSIERSAPPELPVSHEGGAELPIGESVGELGGVATADTVDQGTTNPEVSEEDEKPDKITARELADIEKPYRDKVAEIKKNLIQAGKDPSDERYRDSLDRLERQSTEEAESHLEAVRAQEEEDARFNEEIQKNAQTVSNEAITRIVEVLAGKADATSEKPVYLFSVQVSGRDMHMGATNGPLKSRRRHELSIDAEQTLSVRNSIYAMMGVEPPAGEEFKYKFTYARKSATMDLLLGIYDDIRGNTFKVNGILKTPCPNGFTIVERRTGLATGNDYDDRGITTKSAGLDNYRVDGLEIAIESMAKK